MVVPADQSGNREGDRMAVEARAGRRIALITESFLRLTGAPLVAGAGRFVADALWNLPAVVLAHGREADPVFFYGNHAALQLFEVDGAGLVGMPSRLSAEALERGERQRLLDEVATKGFVADYAGVRVSATGRRFRIARATVWNLIDARGANHGQAATFSDWSAL